jgi:hypothetical protein
VINKGFHTKLGSKKSKKHGNGKLDKGNVHSLNSSSDTY